jgi:hypothetical protein
MEPTQFYILVGLSGLSLAISAVLFLKIKTIAYLLEQPVVKKMSPQLKLNKFVKVDEQESAPAPRHDARPANPSNGNRGPRPNFERPEGGDRQNRDSQPRNDRGPRPERTEGHDRGPRPERTEGGERGPRPDRFSGRDRAPRNDRPERHGNTGGRDGAGSRDGGDRNANRNRQDSSNNNNEPAQASENAAPVSSRPAPMPTPDNHSGPALAPRRPLPSTVEHEGPAKEFTPPEPISADALFMRDDSDIQHGRRNQLKKKPKFDVNEDEAKSVATEESKA